MIRKAEKKDMGAITKLLLQVHEVHAQGRPDIFKPGGIKYDEAELEKVIEDEKNRPVFVYEEDGEVKGYIFCIEPNEPDAGHPDLIFRPLYPRREVKLFFIKKDHPLHAESSSVFFRYLRSV